MDPQQLLATLIQLSDEQQHRIAELLNRLEGQAQTLAHASEQAEHAASALDRSGQNTALHLQAAVRESMETALQTTLTTVSQRVGRAFEDAGRPLLYTLTGVTKAAEETEARLQRAVQTFRWRWGAIAGGAASQGQDELGRFGKGDVIDPHEGMNQKHIDVPQEAGFEALDQRGEPDGIHVAPPRNADSLSIRAFEGRSPKMPRPGFCSARPMPRRKR